MRPLPAGASMSAPVSLFQNPIKMDSHARRSCPPLPSVSLISGRTCLQISGAMPGASLWLPGAVRPSEISAHACRTKPHAIKSICRPVHSNYAFLPCLTLVQVAISKSPRFMRRSGLFNVRQEFSFWCSIRTLSPQTYRTMRTHEGIKKEGFTPSEIHFYWIFPCCSYVGSLVFPC